MQSFSRQLLYTCCVVVVDSWNQHQDKPSDVTPLFEDAIDHTAPAEPSPRPTLTPARPSPSLTPAPVRSPLPPDDDTSRRFAEHFFEIKIVYIVALMGNPAQTYEALPAVWDHTCHPTQVNAPHLNPSQTSRYAIYLPRKDKS